MENMIPTLNKFTLRNQQKLSKKLKPRKISLSSKRILRQDRPQKKLEENNLKKLQLLTLAVLIFSFTYFITSFLPLSFLNTPSIPIETFKKLNLLVYEISQLIENDKIESDKIEQFLDGSLKGVTQVKFFPKGIDYRKEITNKNAHTISFRLPVGGNGEKGVLLVSQNFSLFSEKQFWVRLLISGSVAILIIALLVYKQIRLVTDQVDLLCQHFVKYRRENEVDLYSLKQNNSRTIIGHRIGVLEELWKRFQSMQEELSENVLELEDSKRQLEKTVTDLQLAKKKERRLVELGNTVAEFGHDIRNANGSISSFATLLIKILDKDKIKAIEIVQALTYIRRIQNSSSNVTGLTTDILDFASGRMEIRPEIYQLEDFQEQIESQLGFLDDFPLHYRVPVGQPPFLLRFDGRKIIRVIVNLVKNSWEKFQDMPDTKDGKQAQIEVRFIPQNMRELKIQVVDNGAPIPEKIVSNLFETFKTEGKETGTGLGLSIGKQLIEAHGGTIRGCNLLDNRGVVFEIILPDCVIPAPSRTSQKDNDSFSLTA